VTRFIATGHPLGALIVKPTKHKGYNIIYVVLESTICLHIHDPLKHL